jgi:hypothetical protein
MRYLLYMFVLVLLSSCGATVGYDYDTEKDFSTYKSYNFYPTLSSGLSELDEKRIMDVTDSILSEKGMMRSDTPQLLINFYSNEYVSNSRNTIGVGMGNVGRNTSVGVSTGIPIGGREVNQQLTIDFIDAQKDALVWQAKTDGRYKERATPEQKEKYYIYVLSKVFKKYPPN